MPKKTINFSAIDSWFFKESRPMDFTGESQSIFPPSMQTLTGAIRTWIGEQEQVDWSDFGASPKNPLHKIIGSNIEGDLGGLSFQGVWIKKGGQRLYPAPLHLMKHENDDTLYPLKLADNGVRCDLGDNIRLPELPNEAAIGSKPLENTWVTEKVMQAILAGIALTFSDDNFFPLSALIAKESRVGIARDNTTRAVEKSKLYQTQHIRPKPDVSLDIDLTGLPESCQSADTLTRLGGEGRAARLEVLSNTPYLVAVTLNNIDNIQGIILYLLTPLLMEQGDNYQPLPNFIAAKDEEGIGYWQGAINKIKLRLYGAVKGKTLREGGWDMAKKKPRPDKSFIPVGSVFFCKTNDIQAAISALHNTQIGNLPQYGYGQIAVGIWKKG